MANRNGSLFPGLRRFRSRGLRRAPAIAAGLAALLLAACSGSSGSGAPGASSTASTGGVVTFAESPDYEPTRILPF
jgi:ABC-type glycerol-3-phosphate transport system substrate-binding protein